MTRREEIEIKALSEYRIKEKENKKATGTYDANLPRRKAFIEGAEWMQKKMIERLRERKCSYENDLDAEPRVYERHIQLCAKLSLIENLIQELEE